jgi:hypothetical protein
MFVMENINSYHNRGVNPSISIRTIFVVQNPFPSTPSAPTAYFDKLNTSPLRFWFLKMI